MTQSILAATDFSVQSAAAVARAGELATAHSWPLHLAHIAHPGLLESLQALLGMAPQELDERYAAAVRQQLTAMRATPLPTGQNLVLDGQPAEALARLAGEVAAELLVIGAHGEGFLDSLRLGSTASRLIRRTPCPVLVVKQAPVGSYRRALIATDFFPPSLAALRLTRRLLPDAAIVLVHAIETPFESKMEHAGIGAELIARYRMDAQREARTRLRELVDREALPANTEQIARHGDIARLIVDQAEALDCDLIVVGKHGLGPVEDFLLGSTTFNVLRESGRDVLISR